MDDAFDPNRRPLRIAILWPHWSGYLDAALQGLYAATSTEALLIHDLPPAEAPFDVMQLPAAQRSRHVAYADGYAAMVAAMEDFRPDLILTVSWAHPPFRWLCRRWRGRAVRVMHMDNQWLGTLKQWGGVVISPLFLRPMTDFVFVPGERQARFARRLGFPASRIIHGSYTGDRVRFAPIGERPLHERKAFLCVARLVPEKGIDVLIEAYTAYRTRTNEPWPLIVCGTGSLAPRLAALPGIDYRGFVQPDRLPSIFGEAACFVLPSVFEPYGVVIHEAAMAGMAIICSDACGAGDDFVDPHGANGRVVRSGDVAGFTDAMLETSRKSTAELAAMRTRSCILGATISPERWAHSLLRFLEKSQERPASR